MKGMNIVGLSAILVTELVSELFYVSFDRATQYVVDMFVLQVHPMTGSQNNQ